MPVPILTSKSWKDSSKKVYYHALFHGLVCIACEEALCSLGGVGGEGVGGGCPLLPVIHVYWMTFKGDLASSFKKYRFIPQQQGRV